MTFENYKYKHMKHILNIVMVLIIISLATSSCRKELDIKLRNKESLIVINGMITADSIIKVEVSKSKNILDTNQTLTLSDAEVSLYKNNEFVEQLVYSDSGCFFSSEVPQINNEYKINVSYPGLPDAYAVASLSQVPDIKSINASVVNGIDTVDGTTYKSCTINFDVNFDDAENTADYYFLSLEQLTPFGSNVSSSGYFETKKPELNLNNNFFTLDGMKGRVFSDASFNGENYTASFYLWYGNEFTENDSVSYAVRLLKVNKDIYDYILSYNRYSQTGSGPFTQPVQVLSNVQNGFGFFSGYTITTDTLEVSHSE